VASSEDPTDATAPPAVRASDAERERTATLLREHTAAGRLTPEELSDRLDVAYAAVTVGELHALVEDLPAADVDAPGPAGSPAREHAKRRVLHAVGIAVLVNVAAIAIWLETGADGSFWPKWIVLVSAIRLAFVAWSELGPAPRSQHEARLGRGGVRPRDEQARRPIDRR
jgi:hypothetical protein